MQYLDMQTESHWILSAFVETLDGISMLMMSTISIGSKDKRMFIITANDIFYYYLSQHRTVSAMVRASGRHGSQSITKWHLHICRISNVYKLQI